MKLTEKQEELSLLQEVLAGTTDPSEKAAIEKGIAKLQAAIDKAKPEAKPAKEGVIKNPKRRYEQLEKWVARGTTLMKEEEKELEKLSLKYGHEKAAKKTKVTKPTKAAKPVKAPSKKSPDCNELAAAYKKRMDAVKKASGKKTTDIMKIIGTKIEGAVKSAIFYNEGENDKKALKEAINTLIVGFDKLKSALKGKHDDFYIDKFKEDLMKIIKDL